MHTKGYLVLSYSHYVTNNYDLKLQKTVQAESLNASVNHIKRKQDTKEV